MVLPVVARSAGTIIRGVATAPRPATGRRHYQADRDFMTFKWNERDIQEIRRRLINMSNRNNPRNRIKALKAGAKFIVRSAKQKAPKSAGFQGNAPGKKRRQGNYTGGRKKATGAWRMIEARTGRSPNPGASSVGIGVNRAGFYLRFHETGYFAVGRRSRTVTKRTLRGHISFTTRRAVSVGGVRQYASGTTWVPPQPYLRPALHEKKKKHMDVAMRKYWDIVTKGLPRTRALLSGGPTFVV